MGNVIQLFSMKQDSTLKLYKIKIDKMTKADILIEMMAFQEERKKKGNMDLPMRKRGLILFTAIESVADSQELKILSRSYVNHLKYEIAAQENVKEIVSD